VNRNMQYLTAAGWGMIEYVIKTQQGNGRAYFDSLFVVIDEQLNQHPTRDSAMVPKLLMETKGIAVCYLNDVFITGPKPEEEGKPWLMKNRDALVCQIITPSGCKSLWQLYRRTNRVVVTEERRECDAEDDFHFFALLGNESATVQ